MVGADKATAARALTHVVCALLVTVEATRQGRAVASACEVHARVEPLKQTLLY